MTFKRKVSDKDATDECLTAINVSIHIGDLRKLDQIAKEQTRSRSNTIMWLVSNYLKKESKKESKKEN